jgi:hypothetical protein
LADAADVIKEPYVTHSKDSSVGHQAQALGAMRTIAPWLPLPEVAAIARDPARRIVCRQNRGCTGLVGYRCWGHDRRRRASAPSTNENNQCGRKDRDQTRLRE